jgi:hypothetical protein
MKTMCVSALVIACSILFAFGGAMAQEEQILNQIQLTPEEKRQACLEDCRQWIEMFRGGGGWSDFRRRMHARCVAECEREFWKEWDEQMKDK